MPFGLKNVGAIYERAMTTILYDYMHVLMEDYVDDLLSKYFERSGHLAVLDKIFT